MTRTLRIAVFLLVASFTLPAVAESAKSFYKKGREAEARENYVEAYELYKQAFDQKPTEVRYKLALRRTRFLAAAVLVNRGQDLRKAGQLQEALEQFQRAAAIDPGSFMALQEIARTQAAMAAPQPGTAAEAPPAGASPHQSVLSQRVAEAEGPVDLAPLPDVPVTLKLTEDTRMIYQTIGKLAGINVLFDPDYVPRRIPIELNGVTLEQALEILALQSKTFWRPVTPNTIFVAADTAAKRKELEQNIIRTFYLSNLSTPTELQDVVNAMRQIIEVSRIQPLPTQGAVVVRGTPDQVALAEKLIGDIDKARPEVIVEVAVMQVRRDKLRELGLKPPTSTSIQLQGSTTATGTGGTTTTTGTPGSITLNKLANLDANDFIMTIPAATANFLMNDATTKIIQNPMVRAVDGQKASLKIGDRVPVATGSFQPGIGGVGINPLVNTQFQYLDVGVNIDITPKVHADREITLKIMLDISSVTSRVNIGGIDQPVIGQRKIEHEIRLREGEVNLLGGILEEQDVKSLSGIPGLAQIPILKYFFSSERTERVENELLFALVPRIVRSQELTELNLRPVSVGTGTSISLSRASSPVGAAPPAATPQAAPAPAARPSADGAHLAFDPVAIDQAAGSTFAVNVTLRTQQAIYSVPVQIAYDPAMLQLLNVSNGGFLSRDGEAVALVHRDDATGGTLQITASRPPGSGGIAGEGAVFTLTFLARGAGQSTLSISRPGARDENMNPVEVTAATATVRVR